MGTDVAANIKRGVESVCGWKGSHRRGVLGGGGGGLYQTTQGEWSLLAFGSWETRCIVRDFNKLFSPALNFNLLSRSLGSHSSGLAGSTHTHTHTPHRPKKRVWRTRGGRPFDGGRWEEEGMTLGSIPFFLFIFSLSTPPSLSLWYSPLFIEFCVQVQRYFWKKEKRNDKESRPLLKGWG